MSETENIINRILPLAVKRFEIVEAEVREFISLTIQLFKETLSDRYESRKIQALVTKFRDAGRRSAPWRPTSQRVPGRPQDGADGNRINRWLMDPNHKFYANEINATLVEIKYFYQTLSMSNAPNLNNDTFKQSLFWLLGHNIEPGLYLDPIQKIPLDLNVFIDHPQSIQSGHYFPLDRGGRHIPNNTFLMLKRSNSLQGNNTIEELLELMKQILINHGVIH